MQWIFILIAIILAIYILTWIVTIKPYQKWVLERLSRYSWVLDPWLSFIIPFIDRIVKIDMKERVINTPAQEMITRDNTVVTVDAVMFTQIVDPVKALYEIQDPFIAVSNLSITTLRSIIWTMSLDEVLWERSKINVKVQMELSEETAKRWIKINKLEISRLDPPIDIQEAMSKQMKAEREKRAQILSAEWSKEAAIREAEWIQQKQILEADWRAQAIERIASAKAKALELESIAANTYFKDNAIKKEQLRVIEESLKNNTKYVLDSDIFSWITNIVSWSKK